MLHCHNSTTHSTHTREGKIPHLIARVGGYELEMPVKIKTDSHGSPCPDKDQYGYIYSLPAGRTINLAGEIR